MKFTWVVGDERRVGVGGGHANGLFIYFFLGGGFPSLASHPNWTRLRREGGKEEEGGREGVGGNSPEGPCRAGREGN